MMTSNRVWLMVCEDDIEPSANGTKALNNDGSDEASSKRICCKSCVTGDSDTSAKTQLIDLVA